MPLPIILLALLAPNLPAASVQRLSPDQVERVLDDAAAKREAVEEARPRPGPAIHGEMGVEVGTGGHRAVYGDAFVPLGADGAAILSFSSSTRRDAYRRARR